jgi:hypothetical protein
LYCRFSETFCLFHSLFKYFVSFNYDIFCNEKHVILKDTNSSFQTGIFINDWFCWMCNTDLDNNIKWNLCHSRLLFWESVHMSERFFLNLSGTESRLMGEMPSETGNRNQVHWVNKKPNTCAALRYKDSPLFVLNLKRHELNKSAVPSSSWEGGIQLVKIFYAFDIQKTVHRDIIL